MRTNPSGRRVPAGYNEPEEIARGEMPGIKYSIDVASQEIPDEAINAFYSSRTPVAADAVQTELIKPARDAVNWLKQKGNDRPGKVGRLRSAGRHGNAGTYRLSPQLALQCRIPACHCQHVGSTVCLPGLAIGSKRKNGAHDW